MARHLAHHFLLQFIVDLHFIREDDDQKVAVLLATEIADMLHIRDGVVERFAKRGVMTPKDMASCRGNFEVFTFRHPFFVIIIGLDAMNHVTVPQLLSDDQIADQRGDVRLEQRRVLRFLKIIADKEA